ncbi:UDP-3-O-(3-hydroxymyristoyl)glucosamine N-acyltransferase [Dyadobacter sp. CECT 9275]|uniref:UDP-3-O-(3-hydroxymyristoyl)glucosamine N-acyltransferase n=1 Tax=Dyadobacter helix TaxID=2822344 RepID=A0A916JBV1_9BACT|nr:acetyltransferase [Dyadobacter sp. CECT 9275]CAG4999729.1 UDP-3-O-(3-hydroxymyristoyl)glucosamine N-acyltransferase [Dyadobacter sp. CECT 9275]
MEKFEIVIFGNGDIAQLASYYFETDSNYKVVGFTVDRDYINDDKFEGKPLVAFDEVASIYPPDKFGMFIAISYANLNKLRSQKYHEAKNKGYELVSYVSSESTYKSQYMCGDNCFILEDNTIQPFVKIGSNVTLWSGNHIGHHSIIKDHNFISSHVVISGHCVISPYCFIGVNATLHNNVEIGTENLIAAGAIISKSSAEQSVWVPSKSILLSKKSNLIKL